MTIPDEAVEAARQALHRVRWERMKRMIEGDRRAMGEREPGDPPDMQEDARAALEAAAPHLYPASGEVGEVVKNIDRLEALAWAALKAAPGEWECDCQDSEGAYGAGPDARHGFKVPVLYAGGKQVLTADGSEIALVREEYDEGGGSAWDDTSMDVVDYVVAANPVVILALLSALSEATERAGRMERERDEERERAERAEGERDDAIARWCIRMADVREASGIGVKPMLDEVPGAIKERIDAIEAKTKRTETLIAKARTLSDTLKAYGYPVSAAHWANASGQMSVQARALHLAAEGLIEGLAALRWTEEASQGEGE